MQNYLDLLRKILTHGNRRLDRTGVGTTALFTEVLAYDLQQGFPLVTTKRVPYNLIKAELLWFLSGSSDVRELNTYFGNELPESQEEPRPHEGSPTSNTKTGGASRGTDGRAFLPMWPCDWPGQQATHSC
jgi:thymidylate synthase